MSPKLNKEAPLKEWVDAQDFINFMTYDYMGAWDLNGTASQTPLNPISGLPGESYRFQHQGHCAGSLMQVRRAVLTPFLH